MSKIISCLVCKKQPLPEAYFRHRLSCRLVAFNQEIDLLPGLIVVQLHEFQYGYLTVPIRRNEYSLPHEVDIVAVKINSFRVQKFIALLLFVVPFSVGKQTLMHHEPKYSILIDDVGSGLAFLAGILAGLIRPGPTKKE